MPRFLARETAKALKRLIWRGMVVTH